MTASTRPRKRRTPTEPAGPHRDWYVMCGWCITGHCSSCRRHVEHAQQNATSHCTCTQHPDPAVAPVVDKTAPVDSAQQAQDAPEDAVEQE